MLEKKPQYGAGIFINVMPRKKKNKNYSRAPLLPEKQRQEMEATLIRISPIYRKLRERYSKVKIMKILGIKWSVHYKFFRHPEKYVTIQRMMDIAKALDMELRDVLVELIPSYDKAWYEIYDWEIEELEKKFEKNQR
jgi:hypothetical protein